MERLTTSFNLSIGTGLMLETIFEPTHTRYDEERKIPDKINLNDYDKYYINARTLLRNILSAFNKEEKERLLKNSNVLNILEEILHEEIYIITDLFKEFTKIDVRVFYPNYDILFARVGEKALMAISDSDRVINSVIKRFNKEKEYKFKNESSNRVLITTHTALDLVEFNKFARLDLLESYTGKLKTKSLFYTKFKKYGKNDLSFIPFNKATIFFMGDGVYLKTPAQKRLFYKTAVEYKWNQRTTKDKMLNDLAKVDGDLVSLYREYEKIY